MAETAGHTSHCVVWLVSQETLDSLHENIWQFRENIGGEMDDGMVMKFPPWSCSSPHQDGHNEERSAPTENLLNTNRY